VRIFRGWYGGYTLILKGWKYIMPKLYKGEVNGVWCKSELVGFRRFFPIIPHFIGDLIKIRLKLKKLNNIWWPQGVLIGEPENHLHSFAFKIGKPNEKNIWQDEIWTEAFDQPTLVSFSLVLQDKDTQSAPTVVVKDLGVISRTTLWAWLIPIIVAIFGAIVGLLAILK
jgi:hypothetical protein